MGTLSAEEKLTLKHTSSAHNTLKAAAMHTLICLEDVVKMTRVCGSLSLLIKQNTKDSNTLSTIEAVRKKSKKVFVETVDRSASIISVIINTLVNTGDTEGAEEVIGHFVKAIHNLSDDDNKEDWAVAATKKEIDKLITSIKKNYQEKVAKMKQEMENEND